MFLHFLLLPLLLVLISFPLGLKIELNPTIDSRSIIRDVSEIKSNFERKPKPITGYQPMAVNQGPD